jgi:hypothetical protein
MLGPVKRWPKGAVRPRITQTSAPPWGEPWRAFLFSAALLSTQFLGGCCCDQRSGEIFGKLVGASIYLFVIGFAAAIVVPTFYMIFRAFGAQHRHNAELRAFFPTALRGRAAIVPGVPAFVSLQSTAAMPYSVWIHLDFERLPATFQIELTVKEGSEIVHQIGFDGSWDGEDFGGPSIEPGLSGFTTPDKLYVHRILNFFGKRTDTLSVSLRFAPLGEARLVAGQLLVLAGVVPATPG